MITVPELASEALGSYLSTHLSRRFHSTEAHLTELLPSIARLSSSASETATRSITTSSTRCS